MKCPVQNCNYTRGYWSSHFRDIHNSDLALGMFTSLLDAFDNRLYKIEEEIKLLTNTGNGVPQVDLIKIDRLDKLREHRALLECILYKND